MYQKTWKLYQAEKQPLENMLNSVKWLSIAILAGLAFVLVGLILAVSFKFNLI